MNFVPIQTFITETTTYTSDVATSITVPNDALVILFAQLGPSVNGNYTTVAVSDGINLEIMFLLGVDSGAVTVQRGQEGSTPVTLAAGATVRFVWTETSILAIAPGGTVTITGAGATNVSGGPAYTVTTPATAIAGSSGIQVTGTFPNFNISSTVPSGPPGPTGPAGPSTVVTGTGIAVASSITGGYNINVTSPNFISGTGISVTGTWPNITVTNTQTPGGSGTVTSVAAGTGVSITGTPTINPTISLAATGITPGTYGGITLNASGQVTAITNNFFTNLSTTTSGVAVANPTAGAWTINIGTSSTGTQGLVKLAPATSAGSNNTSDSTSAVTPAGVNAVITALSLNPASFLWYSASAADVPSSYTNTISGLTTAVVVAAGKYALVTVNVEVYDNASTTTVQNFGVAIFDGVTFLSGVSSNTPGSIRTVQYLITGPLSTTLTIKTSALTGTQTLGTYSITIIYN